MFTNVKFMVAWLVILLLNDLTTTFTNVNVAAGTYGNATHYGVVTVAANGRVTSVSTFPVVDSSAIAFSIALG